MRFHRLALSTALALASCGGSAATDLAPFAGFVTERVMVGDVEFETWIAQTADQQAQGLMGATEEDLQPLEDGTPRGMLFVFETESQLAFWMRGTGVPLDLAYATADGTIVEVHDLVPFDETPVVAGQPVAYAFEALAGTFDALGIGVGDVIAR